MTTRQLPAEVYAEYLRTAGKGKGRAVTLEGDRITLLCRYEDRERAKAIPGARWDAAAKCWQYPADAQTATALIKTFHDAAVSADVQGLASRPASSSSPAPSHPYTGVEPAPWSFQRRAYDFAYDKPGVLLALKMGRGKSRVTVDLVMNRGHQRTLILCPLSVVAVWPGQFARWAANPPRVIALDRGSVATKTAAARDALEQDGPCVVVINYESAFREPFAKWALAQDWDCVIADESHKLKSPSGVQSRFASKLTRRAGQRIALTGTPMPHSPLDIFAQYRFLDPSIYGPSFVRFRQRYAIMGGFQNHEVKGFQHLDELESLMGRIAFVLPEGEDIDLPETQHIHLACDLSAAERRAYDELKRDLVIRVADGEVTASNALTELLRLQQIASGYVRTDDGAEIEVGDSKASLLKDTLDGLAQDEPVVVFVRFRHDLDAVHRVAAALGRESRELSGRVNQLAEWQAGGAPVLAVQIQAGGVGIDLTRASYAVYYSLGFSLGDYDQSLARIHRPGQTRPCVYYHITARHTVDETIYAALEARQDLVGAVMDALRKETK